MFQPPKDDSQPPSMLVEARMSTQLDNRVRPLLVITAGVLFRFVWIEIDGFHWFKMGFIPLAGAIVVFPRGHLWS